MFKELAWELVEPLSITFKGSWRTSEMPNSWRRANVPLVFKKGRKNYPGKKKKKVVVYWAGRIIQER